MALQEAGLTATLTVAFELVYRDANGKVIQTVPVTGAVQLNQEQPNGMDHRPRDQQSGA